MITCKQKLIIKTGKIYYMINELNFQKLPLVDYSEDTFSKCDILTAAIHNILAYFINHTFSRNVDKMAAMWCSSQEETTQINSLA